MHGPCSLAPPFYYFLIGGSLTYGHECLTCAVPFSFECAESGIFCAALWAPRVLLSLLDSHGFRKMLRIGGSFVSKTVDRRECHSGFISLTTTGVQPLFRMWAQGNFQKIKKHNYLNSNSTPWEVPLEMRTHWKKLDSCICRIYTLIIFRTYQRRLLPWCPRRPPQSMTIYLMFDITGPPLRSAAPKLGRTRSFSVCW